LTVRELAERAARVLVSSRTIAYPSASSGLVAVKTICIISQSNSWVLLQSLKQYQIPILEHEFVTLVIDDSAGICDWHGAGFGGVAFE
jgi:hypothetical protein